MFADRRDAGRALAVVVRMEFTRGIHNEPLVLAIPRGGVPVGRDVAAALGAELDLVVPRKIGAAANPEYGIGAVMPDGTLYLDPAAVAMTGSRPEYIEAEKAREMEEASRRLRAYRAGRPEPVVKGRSVVVVDDGIATGATMTVALRWVRSQRPAEVVAAAPMAPPSTVERLKGEADRVVCPNAVEPFYAIGAFYDDFRPVTDEEVQSILQEYWNRGAGGVKRWSQRQ